MELFNNNNRILLIISISSLFLSSSLLPSSAHEDVMQLPKTLFFRRPSHGIIPPFKTPRSHGVKTPQLKTPQGLPALSKICAKTTDPGLCTITIRPSLRGGVCSPATALRVEIQACLDSTQAALGVLKKMGGTSNSAVLKEFQEKYESAVVHMKVAAAAIAKHDVGTVKASLRAAVTNYGACKDSVAQFKGGLKLGAAYKVFLTKGAAFKVGQAVTLHKLATNCLAISALL